MILYELPAEVNLMSFYIYEYMSFYKFNFTFFGTM